MADVAVNFACGPEADPYDYYISYFHNNLSETKDYEPFSFTGYHFLYDENEPGDENTTNAKEWVAFLGGDVRVEDAKQALYEVDSATNVLLQGTNKWPDSLNANTFLKALVHDRNALSYYRFAKKVEPLCVVTDVWNPAPRDTVAMAEMGEVAKGEAGKAKDKFLKLRYFYQAQRLLRYAGQGQEAADIYHKSIERIKSGSYIKYLAMAQQAGHEGLTGNKARAAYMFSRVFAQLPQRRVQAYRNYTYVDAELAEVLKLAKNDAEKADIYAIEGFNKPDFEINSLKEIYDCQPESPVIGVLLAREVNKLEEVFLDDQVKQNTAALGMESPNFNYLGYADSSSNNKVIGHIAELSRFCKRLATDKKNPDYALGHIVPAYLAWMQKDTRTGLQHIDQLDNIKMRKALFEQKQIISLLLKAQGVAKLNDLNEASMLPLLQWLDKRVSEEKQVKAYEKSYSDYAWSYYGSRPFASSARNFYQTVLAPAYIKQGNIAKAAAAMAKGDADTSATAWPGQTIDFWHHYLKSAELEQLISWKNSPPANAYLSLLTSNLHSHTSSNMYNLLGMVYLREHNYKAAVRVLQQVSKGTLNNFPSHSYWGEDDDNGADPFVNQMRDYPKKYFNKDSTVYNRLQFAQAMLKLQQQMKAHPQEADNYFKYATGLYNTSMYGNAWYLISDTWSANDYGRKSLYYYDVDYVRTSLAKKYYLLARQYSRNAEFKARCTFMAAKCQQKNYVLPEYDYRKPDDVRAREDAQYYTIMRTNPYFKELKSTYNNTKYYKTAVNECSYLRDFLAGKTVPPKDKPAPDVIVTDGGN